MSSRRAARASRQTRKASVESSPPDSPNDQAVGARRHHATGKARGLDGEDVLRAGIELRLVARNERLLRIVALDAGKRWQGAGRHDPHGCGIARRLREGGIALPRMAEPQTVDVRRQLRAFEPEALRLPEQLAILRSQQVAAEHDVLGRFRGPRTGIEIARDRPCTLHPHEVAAIVRLRHQLRAGGRVQYDLGAAKGKVRTRRFRRPKVFANLDAEAKRAGVWLACLPHFKQQPSIEREHPLPKPRLLGNPRARGEPPFLVELLVVRPRHFRHSA